MKYFIFSFMLNLLKKLKKLVPFTAAFVISAFLFSCNNIFDTQKNDASAVNYDGEGYILTGIITMQNANYVGEARMAVPDNSGIDLTDTTNYECKIYLDGQEKSVSVSNGVFSLGLNSGDNLVKVVVEKKIYSSLGNYNLPVLQSEKTVKISNDAPHTLSEKFVLSPIQDGGDSYGMSLELNVPDSVGFITATLLDEDPSKVESWTNGIGNVTCEVAKPNFAEHPTLINIVGSMVAGSYKIQFDFYDSKEEKNILYSTEQVIELFENLSTTKWRDTTVNSSGKPSPINNSTGKFVLTDEILEDFANTTIYVDPVRGLDNNGGTYYGKLKTLQKAVDTAILRNGIKSGTEEFNILLCGDVELDQRQNIDIDCSSKALKLNIKCDSTDTSVVRRIYGRTGQERALIKIKGKSKSDTIINFEKILILSQQNTTTSAENENQGGGFYVNNAKLTLTRCNVCSHEAKLGAGIYCDTGAEVIAESGSYIASNNYNIDLTDRIGGGIYAAGAVTVKCQMEENKAQYGSGIYVTSDENAKITFDDNAELKYGTYQSNGNTIMKNDVFLKSGKKVTVGTGLTKTSVAYLTPETPARNLEVLSSASTKFNTSYAADSYKIDNSTKLSLANIVTDIYVGTRTVNGKTYAAADPSGNTKDSSTWKHYNSSSTYFQTHPLTSIEKALQFITWQGSNEEYKIYITGTLNGAQTIANSSNANNPITLTKNTNIKKLTLAGASSGTLDGGFAKGTGGNSDKIGTTLTIDTAVPVVISSLTIKNGYQPQGNGGSLYIVNSSADVTLASSSTVSLGKANKGGCIYNKGTLTIQSGATVREGEALVYSDVACGGGIYNEKTLNMEGGSVLYCKAGPEENDTVGDGAGVYLAGSNAVFYMTGGYIGNGVVAKGNGGGIYADTGSKVFMSGTACVGLSNSNATADSGNRYCEAELGGGIYSNAASIYIGYTDESNIDDDFGGGIRYNYATSTAGGGGAIYANAIAGNSGSVKMAAGVIKHNAAYTKGGAVYLNKVSSYSAPFTFIGGEISSNEVKNTTSGTGGAFYVNGQLTVGNILTLDITMTSTGDKKNDIYLAGSGKIINTGITTDTAKFSNILVKPNSYSDGRAIITKDVNCAETTFKDNMSRFKIPLPASGAYWSLKDTGNLQKGLVVTTTELASAIQNVKQDGEKIILTGSGTINSLSSIFNSLSYKISVDISNYTGYETYIENLLQNPKIQEVTMRTEQLSSGWIFHKDDDSTANCCIDLETIHLTGNPESEPYGMGQLNLFKNLSKLEKIYYDDGVTTAYIGGGFMHSSYLENTIDLFLPVSVENLIIFNPPAASFGQICFHYSGSLSQLKNINVSVTHPNNHNGDKLMFFYNNGLDLSTFWTKGNNVTTGTWE